tara:strand:+ start:274 stop:516 length:243 start_codon:yes stop_codon:yes gene_type:complete
MLNKDDLELMAEENLASISKEIEYGVGTPDEHNETGPPSARVWGMTAGQRFLIALMVFLNITVLGLFFLLASGRIDIPIP